MALQNFIWPSYYFSLIFSLKIQYNSFSPESMVTSNTKGQLHCQQMHKNKALQELPHDSRLQKMEFEEPQTPKNSQIQQRYVKLTLKGR